MYSRKAIWPVVEIHGLLDNSPDGDLIPGTDERALHRLGNGEIKPGVLHLGEEIKVTCLTILHVAITLGYPDRFRLYASVGHVLQRLARAPAGARMHSTQLQANTSVSVFMGATSCAKVGLARFVNWELKNP